MEIVSLDNRITFQKKSLEFDELHRQTEEWSDFFTCWCNIKLVSSNENEQKGVNKLTETYSFVVRKMKELNKINSLEYRIIFNNKVFDIIEIDTFSRDKKYLRIKGVTNSA